MEVKLGMKRSNQFLYVTHYTFKCARVCFLIFVALCSLGSYFIKVTNNKTDFHLFMHLFLFQSIQQLNILYNLHSLQQERDKHLVLSWLHYVRDTGKTNKQILQIWHINNAQLLKLEGIRQWSQQQFRPFIFQHLAQSYRDNTVSAFFRNSH